MPDFEALRARHPFRPIPGCPGRLRLVGTQPTLAELLGPQAPVVVHRVAAAPDRVAVCPIPGGGVISYLRADGSVLHTLNTAEGFARKLAQLGIDLQQKP